jgi:hypothetical protein
MAAPRLQRTPSIEQRERFVEHDDKVFKTIPVHVQTGPLDEALLKRKRQNQKRRFKQKRTIQMTVEHPNPAEIIKANVAKTRRGGKRKRHKTRKRRKRKRKRRKHFKGGLFERPGVGIKTGQIVRIKTDQSKVNENGTPDFSTWDPCWKVITKTHRAAFVEKGMEEKVVRDENIKPQGFLSKQKCKKISGGKRRKTRRRKKHRHRHKRRTHKK